MNTSNEAKKEIGKGLINLGNLIGGLSFVNIFMQKSFEYLEIALVLYIVLMGYLSGYYLIRKAEKNG